MKINRKIILGCFGWGLILVGLNSCTSSHSKDKIVEDEEFCLHEDLKKSTEIEALAYDYINEQITLSGKIEYNENDLVAYRSLLDGIVSSVRFELGDYVSKGQVLANIQSVQAHELFVQKKAITSQINFLENQLKIKRELLQDGLSSLLEINEIERELNVQKIELEKVTETLKIYKAKGDGSFDIVAPGNGYIVQKAMSVGQTIQNNGEALFSLSNLKEVWVMVNIYASNLKFVRENDSVVVRTIAYPDTYYPGKIDKIYNVFDDDEHVLKARVVLKNEDLKLMPGLMADIIINKKSSSKKGFAIPNKAKVFQNNKQYVLIYKNDCDIEIRPIQIVAQNELYSYVSEGLKEGEMLVKSNALLLFEQLKK